MNSQSELLAEPFQVEAHDGHVVVKVPGRPGVDIIMTPEAVLESLDVMRRAAYEALALDASRRALER